MSGQVRAVRRGYSLADAFAEFWKHPSPWMIGAAALTAAAARLFVGDWQLTDALAPVVLLAAFPFIEWMIHVGILHWRPLRFGKLTVDPLLARKHREHHTDPRVIPVIFTPWQALLWVFPSVVALTLLAAPRIGLGLTYLVILLVLYLGYEWTHFLIHTDYKPKTAAYRAVWRNHRQHHYKSERYWFTVTSAGTADRVFGTYPDPATVKTSPTARNLHGAAASVR